MNDPDFILEYNIDYAPGFSAVFKPGLYILKTNRYSYTSKGVNYVYDYDNIDKDYIPSVIVFFKDIKNWIL